MCGQSEETSPIAVGGTHSYHYYLDDLLRKSSSNTQYTVQEFQNVLETLN
jgi:tRNA A37 N6-isopentenylltransferase MiaA